MSVSQQILNLVKKFDEHKESYYSSSYNETQLRREFLDPFFETLGWDVSNKQGYAEAYKEVIHEDVVKIGTATKAPDYSFRVGGTRKFFVEAKKPFINIKDNIDPAFQLRRYAWSAKLPLSILTDFQEFAVYDCRLKPVKTDKASIGRILYIKYDEFEKRWDEIASIFSKDSVLKGSFDRFADTNRAKKGTTEVDDVFLSEIENWRDVLARNIAIRNEKLSPRELNFSVQRTIDRLIFLRICEDRGIEDYGRLQAHLNGENIYKRLCVLFREADERYNSGLFHFREEKGREETPDNITLKLDIDDKVLKQIIQNLYYPDSAYEFSVLPADILGQVYEQFLGKVIRLTAGHQAKVEDKPEVKKAGGVFYTPTYIVEYIVKNTVGKLLEDKTPKQAAALRILDPACGSGSFLIGAYQYLLDWHRDWYTKNDPEKWLNGKTPAIYKARAGEYRLSTPERKRILLNNIYGVDIDTQAVEVTKLSLLLKVLEGENEQSIAQQLKLFHERALPDLGNNIKCGNSLIGTNFYEGTQLGMFEDDEKFRVNAFDWDGKDGFQEIMKNGGFDAVIGNPPYVRVQELDYKVTDYIKRHFYIAWKRIDISILFIEVANRLLNTTGINGYITSNQFLCTEYGRKARNFLLKNAAIASILDFGDLPIFKGALTYVSVFFLKKGLTKHFRYCKANDLEKDFNKYSFSKIDATTLNDDPWSLGKADCMFLLNGLKTKFPPLQNFAKCWYGIITGLDDILIIDDVSKRKNNFERKSLLPLIRAQDCFRYSYVKPSKYVIYPYKEDNDNTVIIEENELKKKYPSTFQYLYSNKSKLNLRKDSRKEVSENKAWYSLIRFGQMSVFNKPKIVTPGEVKNSKFALDISNSGYSGARVYGITCENEKIRINSLLGILNSKIVQFYMHSVAPLKQGGYYSYSSTFIETIPVPTEIINTANSTIVKIEELVANILSLNQSISTAKTDQEKTIIQRQIDSTDRRIDELVYELYGLTDEEIKIVEGVSETK